MKPYQQKFDRMLSIANSRKAAGQAITLEECKAEAGVTEPLWRIAFGKTRRNCPELAQQLYTALGLGEMPPAPPRREPAEDDEGGGVEEDQVEEEAVEEEITEADILSNIVAWISRADDGARPRILAAVGMFCGITQAVELLKAEEPD